MSSPEAPTPEVVDTSTSVDALRRATQMLAHNSIVTFGRKIEQDQTTLENRSSDQWAVIVATRMAERGAGPPGDFSEDQRIDTHVEEEGGSEGYSLRILRNSDDTLRPADRNTAGDVITIRSIIGITPDGDFICTYQSGSQEQTIRVPTHILIDAQLMAEGDKIIHAFSAAGKTQETQYISAHLDALRSPDTQTAPQIDRQDITPQQIEQQATDHNMITNATMRQFINTSYRLQNIPPATTDNEGNTTNQEDIDAATQHNTTVEQQREQATSQLGTELLPRADMIAEMVTEVAHLQGCDAISDEQITDVQRELNDLQAQLNQYKNQSDSSEESNKQIPWLEQQIEKKIIELQSLQTAKEQMAKHGGYENVAKLFFQRLEAGLIPAEVATQVRYHLEQGNINELNKIMFAQLHLDTLDKEGRQAMENRLKTLSGLPPWASVLLGMALVLGLKLAEETGRAT